MSIGKRVLGNGFLQIATSFRLPTEFRHPSFTLPPSTGTNHYSDDYYISTFAKKCLPELVNCPNPFELRPLGGPDANRSLSDSLLDLRWPHSRFSYLDVSFRHSTSTDLAPLSFLENGPTAKLGESVASPLRKDAKTESGILVRDASGDLQCPNEYYIHAPGDHLCELLQPMTRLFLEVLGQRRTLMFSPALAERIYHVMYPPGILSLRCGEDEETPGYVVLPWITMIRSPYTSRFRHTIEVSMILVPVVDRRCDGQMLRSLDELPSRPLNVAEIAHFVGRSDGAAPAFSWDVEPDRYDMGGPLLHYLRSLAAFVDGIPPFRKKRVGGEYLVYDNNSVRALQQVLSKALGPSNCLLSMRELTELVGSGLCGHLLLRRSNRKIRVESELRLQRFPDELAQSIALNQTTCVMLVSDEYRRSARNWTARSVASWIDQWTGSQDVQSSVVYDQPAWSLYHMDPLRTFLVLYDRHYQDFPDRSVLQPLGWLAHMTASLSALTEMLVSFYHEVEEPDDVDELLPITSDIVLNFDELYDLDILWRAYRNVYDRCRSSLKINEDYDQLRRKVAAIRSDVEARTRERTDRGIRLIESIGAVVASAILLSALADNSSVRAFLGQPATRALAIAATSVLAVILVVVLVHFRVLRDPYMRWRLKHRFIRWKRW